jgi:hypothetical protein
MEFKIIYPETRWVSESQIRQWYEDAVANGEADEGIEDVREMAYELSSVGHITLSKDRR